ncbi:M14 family zinc carboxypeptidase [Dysgonomonas sp. 511]|uniref:M14 family zinc carboxypeptidase n=1 Tax=Dysgonomonas sp. 511 TaxID=2302930 RepID=UPI0013D7F43D|nr:M14 family zinc carboxypeptidase [Dysgonomonas sp. 511]NDV79575.1 peptidase [Dysgonomonas sp. 511]
MMMRLKILFTLLCIVSIAMAQQPKKMAEKFFPDPLYVTPSFHKKGYVKYDELIKYIEKTIAGKDYISLQYIGNTQKGKQIPAVVFGKSNNPKSKVMLTGRVHGDEPGSTEALLLVIDKLVNDPTFASLVENLEIAILPMVNIDGGDKLKRQTANGLDLNRDMSKLATPENQALRKFFNEFAPDVELDLHEYNPFRIDYLKFGSFGVSGYADVMFLYSENPNYQTPLRNFVSNTYLPLLEDALNRDRLTYCKYFTSTQVNGEVQLNMGGGSPRSSATAFGLANTVSLLIEIRGTNIGKANFKRRVYTGYLIALNTLKMADEKSAEIKEAIRQSTESKADIVVTQRRTEELRKIPFIDIQKNGLIDVEIPVRDAAQRKDGIVRKRPFAYALLPNQTVLADKLRDLGILVETLDKDRNMDAEAYTISDYRESEEKFEGFYEQIVKTEVASKKVNLPKGSFIVKMDQRNSNLAAVVLEPEAENGFVRYHVLPVKLGEELPVYRIINNY